MCGGGTTVVMIVMVFFATGESEDGQRLRFQVELEFVQCLANPNYLLCKYCLLVSTGFPDMFSFSTVVVIDSVFKFC